MTRLYIKRSEDQKVEKRNVVFSTENRVTDKDRLEKAREIPAEYATNDPIIIDALLRDPGYGKTFVHKDDPEGKRKKASFNITIVDAKTSALRNLFAHQGMEFDENKSYEVLEKEYQIHIAALAGANAKDSAPAPIPHTKVDVAQEITDKAINAVEAYEAKTGTIVPEELKNDLGFIDGLSNPEFDAAAYIAKHNEKSEVEPEALPSTPAELQKIYKDEIGKNAPIPKKNDVTWLQNAIKNHREKK